MVDLLLKKKKKRPQLFSSRSPYLLWRDLWCRGGICFPWLWIPTGLVTCLTSKYSRSGCASSEWRPGRRLTCFCLLFWNPAFTTMTSMGSCWRMRVSRWAISSMNIWLQSATRWPAGWSQTPVIPAEINQDQLRSAELPNHFIHSMSKNTRLLYEDT